MPRPQCASTVGNKDGRPQSPGIALATVTNISIDRSVFALPVLDSCLVYAPLHNLAALVNRAALLRLRDALSSGKDVNVETLAEIVHVLRTQGETAPLPKRGDLSPAFLGLLPTRGCNLACRYCGFLASDECQQVMDLALARDAVNWYIDLVVQSGQRHAEIHFFGGEPFCAAKVLDLTVPLARTRARQAGCTVRFEVATNGTFSQGRCLWAADKLDSIVLSLDGPEEIQNRYRPHKSGSGSFSTVVRNARILAEGAADLSVRVCVTDETVERMPETAAWLCNEFRPNAVAFEPLQPSPQSRAAQLEPPDPWAFARSFVAAAYILEAFGIEAVYSTADIRTTRVSFCPVGQDVVIVSPDGALSACYLLPQEWEAKGLDLHLGRMEGGTVHLDPHAVAHARTLNVWNQSACRYCFCRWHCAGGCHVNHILAHAPEQYDRLCIQTRLIALWRILNTLGQDALASEWLQNDEAVRASVLQTSDLLPDLGA
jgi:uncharacterized protein